MLGMITFSFYNEIQISECPDNLYDLKQKIKELYILNENQIDNCLLSYIDKQGYHHYIFKEEHFEQMIPIVESIIIKVEIIDDYKYLTIDNMVDEEYQLYKLDKTDDEETIQYYEDEDYYDTEEIKEVIKEDEKEDKNEDVKEDKNEDEIEEKIEEKNEGKKDVIKYIHYGIKCNICGCEEIKGVRYLCGVCSNFNLCQECEQNYGRKHNHPLLKIRSPELSPISFTCKIDTNT